EILTALPDTPLVLWKRGAALHGLNRHEEALDALHRAEDDLNPLDRARCGIEIALTLIKMSRTRNAIAQVSACRTAFEAAGAEAEIAQCDLLELIARQREEDHKGYLAGYRPIADRLLQLGNPGWYAYALAQAALSLRVQTDYTATETLANEALSLARDLGLTYRQAHALYSLATCAYERTQWETARRCLDEARALVEQSGGLLLGLDIDLLAGSLQSALGNYDGSIRINRRLADEYQRLGYMTGAAHAWLNVAQNHFVLGELQAAGAADLTAEAIASAHAIPHFLGWARLDHGAVQTMLGNNAAAKTLFLRALEHFETVGATIPMTLAATFAAAVCPPDEFEAFATRAAALIATAEPLPRLAVAMRVLGEHLLRHGRIDDAHAQLVRAETFQRNNPHQWSMSAVRLAECELARLGRGDAVDVVGLRAMLDRIAAVSATLPDIGARMSLVRAELDSRDGDAPAALRGIGDAVQAVRTIRLSGDDPVLASFTARTFDPIYWRGARLAQAVNDGAAALSFAEHRRAQWLTRGLNAQSAAPAPRPELDALGRLLRQRRAEADKLFRTTQNNNSTALAEFRREIDRVAGRYAEFEAGAMFSEPSAAALREGQPMLGMTGLRGVFNVRFGRRWQAITLEPLSEDSSEWLILRLSPEDFSLRLAPAGNLIRGMLGSLADGDAGFRRRFYAQEAAANPALRALAKWLAVEDWVAARPARSSPPTLIVADAGQLSRLALGALPLPGGGTLGERAVLRFAPSLNVAAMLSRTAAPHSAPASALVIAPVSFEGRHVDLPESLNEARAMAEIWPGCVQWVGEQASLANVRALVDRGEMARFDVVYLATHALAEPDQLRLSALALRDGDLTLQELLGWRLTARLVCVSACESAFNVSYGGEERVGVETALLAAGARAIVSARWPVDDTATARLMEDFLGRYASGGDAGLALAQTQAALAGKVAASDRLAWRVLGMG
ncbi:MAG: CHAT domain-containing protein, partial [Thermoflexales bacterium]